MGCGTCKSECGREDGCGTRKAEQKTLLDELIARLYPSHTWGQPDDEASFRGGLAAAEARRLQQRLAAALRMPTFYRPGGPDDLCSFVYVLCLGRQPALIDIRDGGGLGQLFAGPREAEAEAPAPEQVLQEQYLRICLSQVSRVAAVQETSMDLLLAGDQVPEGMALLREVAKPGVFDPKLLKRFQKAVDLLLAHGIEHLDMGLLDVPAARFGLDPGDYAERYGVAPGLFNFFFCAEPVQTASASYLPLPRSAASSPSSWPPPTGRRPPPGGPAWS